MAKRELPSARTGLQMPQTFEPASDHCSHFVKGDKWPAARCSLMTAYDWCSEGYDLFDGSQNGRSCHRAATLKLWIADTHVRACAGLSATKARVTHPGIAAE